MQAVTPYLQAVLDFFREGYDSINNLPGALIVALVAVLFMQSWKQLLPMAVLSVVALEAIQILAPVLTSHAAFHLPPIMEVPFWRHAGVLFVGYVVVIAVLFLIKTMLLPKPQAKHA